MIAHLLETVQPDYVQYDCKGHPGYTGYPTRVGWPSPGIQKDSLAIWRKVTRAYGVRLFIHYSGVWDTVAVEHHPKWARLDAEGNPDKEVTSTFGPYCDELLIPQLKEVADAYDLDGVWVDGDCWAVQVDFSPAAREAFTQATGIHNIPTKRGDPHWDEFLTFQRKQFQGYVRKYADALHAHRPGFEITSNWMYSTLVPEEPSVPIDFISGDFSPADAVNAARMESRYISSAGMPWDLMAWGFNKGEDCAWSHKTAVQLRQEASIVLAQGGGYQIYYQPTRTGWLDDGLVQIMGEVAHFCRKRQAVSHKTEPVPQVALLLPGQSLYAQSDRLFGSWGALLHPVHGALHALLELHYSVDVMAEYGLMERRQQYPVVVVPACSLMPDDLRRALLDYVRTGGNLLAIGPQAASCFQEALGVHFEGEPAEVTTYVRGNHALGWLGGVWQEVRLDTAESVGARYPTADTRQGDGCAASLNTYGQGRMAAIYGPLGRVHYWAHYPAVREFLGKVMERLFPAPMAELEGPSYVDMALRRNEQGLLIHLANLAGMQTAPRYAVMDAVPPVGPLKMRARLDEPPQAVSVVPEDCPMESRWEGGTLRVTLPSLEIHAVIVIR